MYLFQRSDVLFITVHGMRNITDADLVEFNMESGVV
jgi:hypothetical protein